MIKTHPTALMLRAFAADELPLPLAVGVSAHCELCPDCAARVKECEEELAREHLMPDEPDEALPPGFDAMLAGILQQPAPPVSTRERHGLSAPELRVAGQSYRLPRVLARHHDPRWRHLGAIRQHNLPLDEMGARASLLHIEAGGRIPEHTHKGYELTLHHRRWRHPLSGGGLHLARRQPCPQPAHAGRLPLLYGAERARAVHQGTVAAAQRHQSSPLLRRPPS